MAVATWSQAQSPGELLVVCLAAPGAALGGGLCGEAAYSASPAGHGLSNLELCWTISWPFANLGIIEDLPPGKECVSVWADSPFARTPSDQDADRFECLPWKCVFLALFVESGGWSHHHILWL